MIRLSPSIGSAYTACARPPIAVHFLLDPGMIDSEMLFFAVLAETGRCPRSKQALLGSASSPQSADMTRGLGRIDEDGEMIDVDPFELGRRGYPVSGTSDCPQDRRIADQSRRTS